jgi:hypothetical protein
MPDSGPNDEGVPVFFWVILGLALLIVAAVVFVAVNAPVVNVVNVIR